MSDSRELKLSPSVTGDGSERELRQISGQEKEEFRERICRMVGRDMSSYYSAHQEEWEEFLKAVSQGRDR